MVKTILSVGSGLVLPESDKLTITETSTKVRILHVAPENGYTDEGEVVPHENLMVRVEYPEGVVKNHQCKNIDDLMGKITSFIKRRFDINDFIISDKLSVLESGQILNVEIK